MAPAYVLDALGDRKCGLIDKAGKWVILPTFEAVSPCKNFFSVITSEPHEFSAAVWRENWDHQSDLLKLFRDKQVIGMKRTELVSLIGAPFRNAFDYGTYVVSSSIDAGLMIDFAFDGNDKVYRWRQRVYGPFASPPNQQEPAWSYDKKYEAGAGLNLGRRQH